MTEAAKPSRDSAKAKLDAIALAEQAEAEAAEAEALAAAARARARAIQLRRAAEAQAADEAEDTPDEPEDTEQAAEDESTQVDQAVDVPLIVWTPDAVGPVSIEPGRRVALPLLLAAVMVTAICLLLGASGWMAWHHHNVEKERQRAAAYAATARQGVINLTSLDFNKSKEDVQRILDSATGEFRDQFQKTADDFASVVKDTNAVAQGTVAATAIESTDKDSAVVLVLAHERVTNAAGAKDQPRTFRFRVSVVHDGDQLKLSKVEFVL